MTQDQERPSRLEPFVTFILFGSVFGSLGLTLSHGNEYVKLSSDFGRLPAISRDLLETLERELALGRVIAHDDNPGSEPLATTYVSPIDVGEDDNGDGILGSREDADGDGELDLSDGDVHDRDQRLQWGCLERNRPSLDRPASPHRLTLTFESLEQVSEAELGLDINGDDDELDKFARGNIVRLTSAGEIRRFGAGMVVLPLRNSGGHPFLSRVGDDGWRLEVTFLARTVENEPRVVRIARTIQSLNQGIDAP